MLTGKLLRNFLVHKYFRNFTNLISIPQRYFNRHLDLRSLSHFARCRRPLGTTIVITHMHTSWESFESVVDKCVQKMWWHNYSWLDKMTLYSLYS